MYRHVTILLLGILLAACGGSGGSAAPGGQGGAQGDEVRVASESGWWTTYTTSITNPPTFVVDDWASGDATHRLYVGFSGVGIFSFDRVRAHALMRFDLTGLPSQVASAQVTFEVLGLQGDSSQIGGLQFEVVETTGAYDAGTPHRWSSSVQIAMVVANASDFSTQKTGTKSVFVTDFVNQALAGGRTSIEFALREIDGVDVVDGSGDYYVIGSQKSLSPPRLAITK